MIISRPSRRILQFLSEHPNWEKGTTVQVDGGYNENAEILVWDRKDRTGRFKYTAWYKNGRLVQETVPSKSKPGRMDYHYFVSLRTTKRWYKKIHQNHA